MSPLFQNLHRLRRSRNPYVNFHTNVCLHGAHKISCQKKKKATKSKATIGSVTDEEEIEFVENEEVTTAPVKAGLSNTVRFLSPPSLVSIMLAPPKPHVKICNNILNQFFPVTPGEEPPSVDSFRYGVRGTLAPCSVNISVVLHDVFTLGLTISTPQVAPIRASVASLDLSDIPGLDSSAAPFAKAQHYITKGGEAQKNARKRARTEPLPPSAMMGLFRECHTPLLS